MIISNRSYILSIGLISPCLKKSNKEREQNVKVYNIMRKMDCYTRSMNCQHRRKRQEWAWILF